MAHEVAIVTEAELRRVVPLDIAAVAAVENAFARLASGEVIMPPIPSMNIPAANGEVGAVISGAAPGRRSADDVNISDHTGAGAQDAAIATHARALRRAAGIGSVIET